MFTIWTLIPFVVCGIGMYNVTHVISSAITGNPNECTWCSIRLTIHT